MNEPSGDHAGAASLPNSETCTAIPPPEGITQTSSVARHDENATLEPSGDHAGLVSRLGCVVSCLGSPPDAGTIQMSKLPLRVEENAICVPSGDQVGSKS